MHQIATNLLYQQVDTTYKVSQKVLSCLVNNGNKTHNF